MCVCVLFLNSHEVDVANKGTRAVFDKGTREGELPAIPDEFVLTVSVRPNRYRWIGFSGDEPLSVSSRFRVINVCPFFIKEGLDWN